MAINVTAGKGIGTQGMNLAAKKREEMYENNGLSISDLTAAGRKNLGSVDTETFMRPEETEAEGDVFDYLREEEDAAIKQDLLQNTAITPPLMPTNMQELSEQKDQLDKLEAQRESELVKPMSAAIQGGLDTDTWEDTKLRLSEETKGVASENESDINKINISAPLNGAFLRANWMAEHYIPGSTLKPVEVATLLARSYKDEFGNVIPNWDAALTASDRTSVLKKRDEKFKKEISEAFDKEEGIDTYDYGSEEFQTGLFGVDLDTKISGKGETKGQEIERDVPHPIFEKSRLNTINQTIIFHSDLLDAGVETKSKTGQSTLTLDPKFKEIMSLATEAWIMQQMFIAPDEHTTVSDDPNAKGFNTKSVKVSASKGSNKLGRDIFQAWKRQQAQDLGLPTDTYIDNYEQISSSVFTHIGNMAKRYYSQVNPKLFKELDKGLPGGNESARWADSYEQTQYEVTDTGMDVFTRLNKANWGLFSNEEVKPLNAASDTGQFMFEGKTRTKDETTKIPGKKGDDRVLNEARKNMNSVAMVTSQRRLSTALMMGMLGLVNAGGQNAQTGKFNFSVLGQANKDYANMFGIGEKKYDEMVGEKKTLNLKATRAEKEDSPKAPALRKAADSYDPDYILNTEREKFISIIEAAGRYSSIPNHLTFAIQRLTGRMHAQQTLFNPQAHKLIRFIVGGKNKYQWKAGDNSKLDKGFKLGMSAKLFEHQFKKDYRFKRSNELRIRVFDDLAAQTDPNSEYNKKVRWGKTLQELVNNFDTKKAKEQLAGFKTVKNQAEEVALKKSIFASLPDKNPIKDKGLREFLAGEEEEGIAMADYLMDLAAYDDAKKKGTFHNSDIIFEADGITHGPSTMAMILGSTSIAKRAGVLIDQDFSKMMELKNNWEDLRDHMARVMVTTLTENSQTIGISGENKERYLALLKLAIDDRQNFLKQSPMTMGYGQEIMSLRDHVDTTIFINKDIEDYITKNLNGNFEEASDFLHSILVDSIYKTFEPETIDASRLIKNNAYASAMTDIRVSLEAPAGNALNILGGESVQQKFQTVFSELVMEDENTFDKFGRMIPKKFDGKLKTRETKVTHYQEAYTPSARRMQGTMPIQGGWTTGRLLPALVQPYDANMIARTLSGNSWNRIVKESTEAGNAQPFVLPIFDAFLVDLGSMNAVLEESNKHHIESIFNHNYVDKVAVDWYSDFKKTIDKIPDNIPLSQINFNDIIRAPIGQETGKWSWGDAKKGLGPFRMLAMNTSVMDLKKTFRRTKTYDMKPFQEGGRLKAWDSQKKKLAELDAEKALDEIKRRGVNVSADDITGKDLKEIIDVILISPLGLNLEKENRKLVETTKRKRSNLISLIKKQIAEGRLTLNINI